jgi:ribosomal protein S18 acetylase RimI-like enzyme
MNKNVSIVALNTINNHYLKDIESLLVQLNPDFVPPAEKEKIQTVISNPDTHILVALDKNKLVGMITLCCAPQIEGNIKAWIEDFIVDGSYQGQGIGTSLIQEAHKKAKKLGFKSTRLTSRPSRVVANEYYKKIGYKQYHTNVYKIEL